MYILNIVINSDLIFITKIYEVNKIYTLFTNFILLSKAIKIIIKCNSFIYKHKKIFISNQ